MLIMTRTRENNDDGNDNDRGVRRQTNSQSGKQQQEKNSKVTLLQTFTQGTKPLKHCMNKD